jgi:hypothetical protein
VEDAIHEPKSFGGRMPILIGGNGPKVTWRLAARFADELNVDGLSPEELRAALPVIRARCEEIGRDPHSLSVSLHVWWGSEEWSTNGDRRLAFLGELADLGVSRVIGLLQQSAVSDEPLQALAEDARAAGVSLAAHG